MGSADTEAMIQAVRRRFMPARIVVLVDAAGPLKKRLLPLLPFIEGIVPIKGKAAAYVCVDFSCRLPTSDLAEFERQLDEVEPASQANRSAGRQQDAVILLGGDGQQQRARRQKVRQQAQRLHGRPTAGGRTA